MGERKRRKQSRQGQRIHTGSGVDARGTSATQADTGHAVQPASTPKPRQRQKPIPRDAVTGTPLRRDVGLYLRVSSHDESRTLYRGESIPLRLHTRQTDGRLGGLAWSPAFGEYISHALPAMTAESWARLNEWHAVPYIVATLRRILGDQAVDAVLAVTLDRAAYERTAERLSVSPAWIRRQERRVYQQARELLFGPARLNRTATAEAAEMAEAAAS